MPSIDLLKFCTHSPCNRIIFIQGPSGSGKSTLLKKIHLDILQKPGERRNFTGSDAFQIPLLFTCKTLNCKSLPELISKEFPDVTARYKSHDVLKCTISPLKCIFLLDGLDEVNENSSQLVEDILDFLKINVGMYRISGSYPVIRLSGPFFTIRYPAIRYPVCYSIIRYPAGYHTGIRPDTG